jgi:hypothetical protein
MRVFETNCASDANDVRLNYGTIICEKECFKHHGSQEMITCFSCPPTHPALQFHPTVEPFP